jgi:inner membrane protein
MLLACWARNRFAVWGLALGAFHLHLVCDFLGSGIDWPIQYFWPFSDTFYHTFYGWELDAWQNWVIAVMLILISGRLTIISGHSFAETFLTKRADETVVLALRQRFAPKWIDPATSLPCSTAR